MHVWLGRLANSQLVMPHDNDDDRDVSFTLLMLNTCTILVPNFLKSPHSLLEDD
jgi:hypothetical protein